MTWELHEMDCRLAMGLLMDADSVDSIVCDPPYGLSKEPDMAEVLQHWLAGDDYAHKSAGFMNASWDSFVPGPSVWREAYRVLKPGGHLVAFFGTRTYDLGVLALRLAGFEIRDSLYWHYGSGFPKSHNISKKLAEAEISCQCHKTSLSNPLDETENLRGLLKDLDSEGSIPSDPQSDVFGGMQGAADRTQSDGETVALQNGDNDQLRGLRETQGNAFGVASESLAADLQPTMQRGSSGRGMGQAWGEGIDGADPGKLCAGCGQNARNEKPGMERRRDPQATEGELFGCSICSVSSGSLTDGAEGRLHHGTSPSDGENVRLSDDQNGSGQSYRSRPVEQSSEQSGTMADERGPQTWRGWPVCGGCGKPRIPEGLGTALKPSTEPIVLARKPLVGTVARNVLSHGTGALNIDGCRVHHADVSGPRQRHGGGVVGNGTSYEMPDSKNEQPPGRWPANLAHDGSPEVLAGFPYNKSPQPRKTKRSPDGGNRTGYGRFGGQEEVVIGHGDEGSAARFFYCAKASKSDRNEGLDDLPERASAASEFRPNHTEGAAAGEDGNPYGRWSPVRNAHPTVKPTALMQWLVRLVTPPGGTVLDPFTGSGSTGVACAREGFSFVGCEMTAEYVPIIRGRVGYAYDKAARVDHAVNSR